MKQSLQWLLAVLIIGCINMKAMSQIDINVETSNIIATSVGNKYGINVNAGVDHDDNRDAGARSLADAILETGSKHIRYPGGKKSLYFAWTADPDNPDPSTNYWVDWYASVKQSPTLNFDEFMALCNETGAEPHVNVAVNPLHPDIFNEKLAAEWVRYANITNNYNVKYWEIGNEMWHKGNYNDHIVNLNELVEIVNRFSAAMKAVDPTIKVGVSWNKGQQQSLINSTGSALDFIAITNYTDAGGTTYADYKDGTDVYFINNLNTSISLNTVISEFNRSDWSGSTWDGSNDTGKGLINFDFIGQILGNSKVVYGCLWNTRWYPDSIGVYGNNRWNSLDNQNNLRAVVRSFVLWEKFIGDDLVKSTSEDGRIVTYATRDNSNNAINIFLINKETTSLNVTLSIPDFTYISSEVWQFKGDDEWDKNPTVSELDTVSGNPINYTLPSTSITVFSLTHHPRLR